MTQDLQQDKANLLRRLSATGPELDALYREADALRRERMGDDVFLRGIIEFSNLCNHDCFYCGIRRSNRNVRRYRLGSEEILATAKQIAASGQTTIVLQSGEAPALGVEEFGQLIRRIKRETRLAVTLSVGVRPMNIYRFWRDCGMDRFLLRFETSDPVLYKKVHPDSTLEERIDALQSLRELGVQTGSGFLIGLPGETLDTVAENILLCRQLELDMIGIGPFIPHPDTPLGKERNAWQDDPEMPFRALAALRLWNPDAHIPATTAFDAVFPGTGRDLALQRGANVFMPNATPARVRKDYQLYPGKPCLDESQAECASCVVARIERLGRKVGKGPGHSKKRGQGSGVRGQQRN